MRAAGLHSAGDRASEQRGRATRALMCAWSDNCDLRHRGEQDRWTQTGVDATGLEIQ